MTQQTSQQLDSLDACLSTLKAQVGGLRHGVTCSLEGGASTRVEECKRMASDFRHTLQRMVEAHDRLIRALNAE
jgi:hypothetical protein